MRSRKIPDVAPRDLLSLGHIQLSRCTSGCHGDDSKHPLGMVVGWGLGGGGGALSEGQPGSHSSLGDKQGKFFKTDV